MLLKNYQEKAKDELVEKSIDLLSSNYPSKLILKAPTGSGKTIITAEYLVNRLIYNYQEETNYLEEYINS